MSLQYLNRVVSPPSDIFKVSPPPGKRETSGPNPCLSSDSVAPVHLQHNSKQRPGKWNAWAERQHTMWSTWMDWNELVLTKPGGWERVPSKLRGLICLIEWETPRSWKKPATWLVPVTDTSFPFFSGHYHCITTAAWINSLIASVKQTETGNIRTVELNSMNPPSSALEPVDKVSVQSLSNNAGGKDNRKCQTKTIQSASHIRIRPSGSFCNKPAVVVARANYEGSGNTTG